MPHKIGFDIFSGAGGLSLGAEWAGIKVLYAIEREPNSAKTYKKNHPNTNVIMDDIQNINPEEYRRKNGFFILFGGPPCQGFSTSNRKTRNDNNTNNSLFQEFLRFVSVLSPKWILFENVEGLVNYNDGKTLKQIKKSLTDLGYQISDKVLYASDYGVPQKRNRYFIVGNNAGIDFQFPESQLEVITVNDAIGDLPLVENGCREEELPYRRINPSKYAVQMRNGNKYSLQNYVSQSMPHIVERFAYIKQGENWRAIPEELMANYKNISRCHSGIYKRLVADKPSVVISNYRKNMLIHPFSNRGLSVREAARLQSFPDDFIFEGSIHYIQQQIGNAVPPLLAKAIFEQILKLDNNGF